MAAKVLSMVLQDVVDDEPLRDSVFRGMFHLEEFLATFKDGRAQRYTLLSGPVRKKIATLKYVKIRQAAEEAGVFMGSQTPASWRYGIAVLLNKRARTNKFPMPPIGQ